MLDLKNKNTLVVGLARSGVAAANFLLDQGASVRVTDLRSGEQLEEYISRLEGQVNFTLGKHRQSDFLEVDLIVLSPGVPTDIGPLQVARQAGIQVIGEIEFASHFLAGKVVGVTGANGKTTTTALIGKMHGDAGHNVEVAGNIGRPLVHSVRCNLHQPEMRYIVELSSFQLESIDTFRCDVALVLNLTPGHQDRYPDFQAYVEAKRRILLNQHSADVAVFNYDDPVTNEMQKYARGKVCFFSRREDLGQGLFIRDGSVVIRWDEEETELFSIDEIRLRGDHNLENVLAATCAGFFSDVPLQVMAETVRKFSGIEHRLEWVANCGGVDYYNDSKATNVFSTEKAVLSFNRPIVLIMGGLDKAGDFGKLSSMVEEKVRCLILIGEAAGSIAACLEGVTPTVEAEDMEQAVSIANENAVDGDVVILAPGCASFDMFKDFEHRGDCFKRYVLLLGEQESKR